MSRKLLALAALSVVLATPVVACHDDHDHASDPASCAAIAEACHSKDTGSGPAHDCHGLAESGKTEAECAAKKAECLTTCAQAASDAGGG